VLEITKTVLSLMLVVVITILTTLTTTIEVYAGGDDDGGDDGNKQKAEDGSAAAIADCDDNDVEEARFLCIALATNDVEIETEPPSEEPPGDGLAVCKVVEDPSQEVEPEDFTLTVTDSGGHNFVFSQAIRPPACEEERIPVGTNDGEMNPGEYEVIEGPIDPSPDSIEITGDCVDEDPADLVSRTATGVIQEGETQTCTFINS
jgi:hypothetical protein